MCVISTLEILWGKKREKKPSSAAASEISKNFLNYKTDVVIAFEVSSLSLIPPRIRLYSGAIGTEVD